MTGWLEWGGGAPEGKETDPGLGMEMYWFFTGGGGAADF